MRSTFLYGVVLIFNLGIVGCSQSNNNFEETINRIATSTEDMVNDLKPDIQSQFDNNENLKKYHIKLMNLTIMKVQGNSYKGLAEVEHEGDIHKMTVDIVYDGANYMWEIAPSDLMPITTKKSMRELEGAIKDLDSLAQEYSEDEEYIPEQSMSEQSMSEESENEFVEAIEAEKEEVL